MCLFRPDLLPPACERADLSAHERADVLAARPVSRSQLVVSQLTPCVYLTLAYGRVSHQRRLCLSDTRTRADASTYHLCQRHQQSFTTAKRLRCV